MNDCTLILHIFNPENDLALADGGANYCPPPAAAQIAYDLASLPLWFAGVGNAVILPDEHHLRFYNEMSAQFALASPYDASKAGSVEYCRPWGWSPQIRRRLKAMGFSDSLLPGDADVEAIRALSNRCSSIRILAALGERGVELPPMPRYLQDADAVAAFVNILPRCVVKAPWSGSGKGIAWGIGRVETPMEHFYKGVIRRQGGVVCEHFLSSVQEFAMEFYAGERGVSFVGYSLFDAAKGSYSGNLLAEDCHIECVLSQLISLDTIHSVRVHLEDILSGMLAGSGYCGYLGVDMMIYNDGGHLRLNPCMELNLRMNMGVVSRLFHNNYVEPGATGRYFVDFYKKPGDAYEAHQKNLALYPLDVSNGRVRSGYLNLSPVLPGSRYAAYAIVDGR